MFSLGIYDNSHCMTVKIGHMTNIMLIRIILSLYWDIAHTGFQKFVTCIVLYWYLCLNGNLHIKRTMQQIIKHCTAPSLNISLKRSEWIGLFISLLWTKRNAKRQRQQSDQRAGQMAGGILIQCYRNLHKMFGGQLQESREQVKWDYKAAALPNCLAVHYQLHFITALFSIKCCFSRHNFQVLYY